LRKVEEDRYRILRKSRLAVTSCRAASPASVVQSTVVSSELDGDRLLRVAVPVDVEAVQPQRVGDELAVSSCRMPSLWA
jgi:hypothetical protein